jgi:hypothetical protein
MFLCLNFQFGSEKGPSVCFKYRRCFSKLKMSDPLMSMANFLLHLLGVTTEISVLYLATSTRESWRTLLASFLSVQLTVTVSRVLNNMCESALYYLS